MRSTISPPSMIDRRYVLHQALGAGGMGVVFRATDRLTGQAVALKCLLSRHRKGDTQTDVSKRLALSREFQTLASLRHPHIISVLDYGFDQDQKPYFTMPLLENAKPLRTASQNQPFISKIDLIIQIFQALVYLHRHDVIHRDLKPENILVTEDGQVKVLDFGLAVVHGTADAETFGGTMHYIAPEILQGEKTTRASDLYAIGVIIYEIIVGQHPFQGDTVYEVLHNILTTYPDITRLETILHAHFSPDSDSASDEETEETQDAADLATFELSDTELANPVSTVRDAAAPVLFGSPFTQVIQKLLARDPAYRSSDAQDVIRDLCAALDLPLPKDTYAIRESFLQAANFVGREMEFTQLSSALDQLRIGQSNLWLVGGESGVGKSRLLDELRTLALVKGILVLRGQAISEGGLPYQLWHEPLRRLALAVEVSDAEASILKQIVPDMERLLERNLPNAPSLEGTEAEQRLISTIIALFSRYFEITSNGMLVILEDMQWTSKSIDVINLLQPLMQNLPLMIVGSYRDDEAPDLSQRLPGGRVLKLNRLQQHAISKLSESMLGSAGRKTEIVKLLERETEGNAFFLVEVIRALAEEAGDLDHVGVMTLPPVVFAGGIQEIVQRRLNKVAQAYRPLLNLAAVAGRQLDLKVLEQVAGDIDLDTWLAACVNAAVIDLYDERWRFAHDKLREQLLAELPDEGCNEMHRTIAEALENVYQSTINEHAVSLAYHWSFTDNHAKTVHYSRIAGNQTVDISAYHEARTHFEAALKLVAADAAPDAREQEIVLRIQVSDIYQLLGMYDTAKEHLQQALPLAITFDNPLYIARAQLIWAWVSLREGDMDAAAGYTANALTAALKTDDSSVKAQAYYLTALLPLIKGEYAEARGHLMDALPVARQSGDRAHVANILNALGAVEEGMGSYDEAARNLHEAHQIAVETGHRFLAANSQGNLAKLAYQQGSFQQSVSYCNEALRLFREIGNVYGEATMLYILGFNKVALDEDALADLIASVRLSMELGAETVALIALCGVARLWIKQGNNDSAAELLGVVFNHPDSGADIDIEKEGRPLVDQLEKAMPDFSAVYERGKVLSFADVTAKLINHE